MSPVLVLLVMVCLPVSVFLDEAAMWFARNSLDSYAGEEEQRTARKFARSANHAHLLSRFLVSLAFAVLIFSATRTPTLSGVMISLTVALVWAFFTAALSGVHWRSPLSLIGRAMIRPLGFLGAIPGWIFSVWGRMAGEESGENEGIVRRRMDFPRLNRKSFIFRYLKLTTFCPWVRNCGSRHRDRSGAGGRFSVPCR